MKRQIVRKRRTEACEEPGHGAHATPPLDVDALARASALFRAIGDPARLRILHILTGGRRCVSELAETTRAGLSTVSQQLKTLRAERLVTREREGKHIYYTLTDKHVAELVRSALEHASEPPGGGDD